MWDFYQGVNTVEKSFYTISNYKKKEIRSLHPDTFKDLVKLKRVNLIKNRIRSLPETLFKNCPELIQITLSLNKIAFFEPAFLSNLSKLERFYAHTNHLEVVSRDLFKNLTSLKLIDLGFNRIDSVESEAFADLPSLEVLDLSRNQIKHLDSTLFQNLSKLSELYLFKNALESINSVKMSSMTLLKTIQLDFNQITNIDRDLFKENRSLIEIYCNTAFNMKDLQENIMHIHKQEFLSSIDFICQIATPESLLNSKEAYNKLDYISYFSNRYKQALFQLVDEAKQTQLTKFLAENIKWLLKDLATHLAKFKPYFYEAEKVSLKILELVITIAKNLSVSYNFCKTFASHSGIGLLFGIINSSVLKTEIPRLEKRESKYEYKVVINIYGSGLSILYQIITKTLKEFEKELVEHAAFESLIRASVDFDTISDFRLKAYMSMAHLFVDKDVSQLGNVKPVIKELASYTGMCATKLGDNKDMERCPVCFETEEHNTDLSRPRETIIIQINESYFYLTEFLDVMYNFAVSDEIKYDIYEVNSMKTYLRTFILRGNTLEKDCALKLLWQLCYDQRVADHLQKDTELFEYIKSLVASHPNDKNLIKNVKGVLWLTNGMPQKRPDEEETAKVDENKMLACNASSVRKQQQHIMISYNSKSRQMCLSIKSELERRGMKVWIDVESISGSSLESMASAIENSMCVLVCVTEKYKESNFCRLEAEYLIQQKKPFVPILMQKGWI